MLRRDESTNMRNHNKQDAKRVDQDNNEYDDKDDLRNQIITIGFIGFIVIAILIFIF